MKQYQFNSVIVARIWILGFILWVVLILFAVVTTGYLQFQLVTFIVITLGIIALFYLAARRYALYKTVLSFDIDRLSIARDGQCQKVNIKDIASYKINFMSGVRIDMKLRNGENIVMIGSDYFNNWEPLQEFCHDFDEYVRSMSHIEQVRTPLDDARIITPVAPVEEKTEGRPLLPHSHDSPALIDRENNEKAVPRREKSFHEKKYTLPLLLVFSVFTVGILFYIYLVDRGSANGPMIMGLAGLMAMWGAYLKHAANGSK
ncbi:MAG: hypothetical protein WBB32_09685 [Flavobacteriales bacterium]